jgi:hypothetical protein
MLDIRLRPTDGGAYDFIRMGEIPAKRRTPSLATLQTLRLPVRAA